MNEAEAPTVELVYVTAPGCHFCERGRTVLTELRGRHPITVREVSLTSPEGRAAAARWRVPYPPIVVVDGELAGYGRLSFRSLDRLLAARVQRLAEGSR